MLTSKRRLIRIAAKAFGAMAVLAVAGGGLISCGDKEDEAEKRRNEGPEIQVEARLTARSVPPTLEEIAPYDEALVYHEYEVLRVLRGELDSESVRAGRWAVLGSKEQAPAGETGSVSTMTLVPVDEVPGLDRVRSKDDLAFDPDAPLYLDLSQSLAMAEPSKHVRYDYRGDISRRLRTYWLIRNQLRLVVLGNSHAACGVDPSLFYAPENGKTPSALSMSPAGSGMDFQCLLAREYVSTLPNIEWVVWAVSPRIFNARAAYDRRHELFIESPGYQYDRKHWSELWPVEETAEPMTVEDILTTVGTTNRPWGWSPSKVYEFPDPLDEKSEREILHRCRMDRFKESPELWEQFEETLALLTEKGIKVLLFTPPYHPLVVRGKAVDMDGTGREAYAGIVARLESLAAKNPLVLFEDIHRAGEHDFPNGEFANPDHLSDIGAHHLTSMLVEIVERERGE
jgi:hypothetical protein